MDLKKFQSKLIYLPKEGHFLLISTGKIAGYTRKDQRKIITLFGRQWLEHRLVWLFETGTWPVGDIDHIDGQPFNNRFDNLRDVSRTTNSENRKSPGKRNTTGYLGVFRTGHKYYARIRVNKVAVYLGVKDTAKEAYQLYLNAKRQLHKGNTL